MSQRIIYAPLGVPEALGNAAALVMGLTRSLECASPAALVVFVVTSARPARTAHAPNWHAVLQPLFFNKV